jgi:NADH-quinone oxidoreductase subunit G
VAAARLRACVQASGPSSVAVLCSASATLEAGYLVRSLAVEGLGTTQLGSCLHATMRGPRRDLDRLMGHTRSSCGFGDVDEADLILLVGCDPRRSHPGLAERIQLAGERGATLVIIHSNWIELGRPDGAWFDPLRGKISRLLLELLLLRGGGSVDAIDAPGVPSGHRDLIDAVPPGPTGLSEGERARLLALLEGAERIVAIYDLDDSCERSERDLELLACLMLELGQLQGPGRGLLLLQSEANAAGAALIELHDDLAPLFDSSRLAGLLVIGEDPLANPELGPRLRSLDCLVVLGAHPSRSAALADVALPIPRLFEQEGTFVASDGRVGVLEPVAPAPDGRSVLAVLADLQEALCGIRPSTDPARIREEICLDLGLAADRLESLRQSGGSWEHRSARAGAWAPEPRGPVSCAGSCLQGSRLRTLVRRAIQQREEVT